MSCRRWWWPEIYADRVHSGCQLKSFGDRSTEWTWMQNSRKFIRPITTWSVRTSDNNTSVSCSYFLWLLDQLFSLGRCPFSHRTSVDLTDWALTFPLGDSPWPSLMILLLSTELIFSPSVQWELSLLGEQIVIAWLDLDQRLNSHAFLEWVP